MATLASPLSDAERLMSPLTVAVAQSPYRIAPERAAHLNEQIFGGVPFDLVFYAGGVNFEACVTQRDYSLFIIHSWGKAAILTDA
jgi:hypothetical protein